MLAFSLEITRATPRKCVSLCTEYRMVEPSWVTCRPDQINRHLLTPRIFSLYLFISQMTLRSHSWSLCRSWFCARADYLSHPAFLVCHHRHFDVTHSMTVFVLYVSPLRNGLRLCLIIYIFTITVKSDHVFTTVCLNSTIYNINIIVIEVIIYIYIYI